MSVGAALFNVGAGHQGAHIETHYSTIDNREELYANLTPRAAGMINTMADAAPQYSNYISQLVALKDVDAMIAFLSKGRIKSISLRNKSLDDKASLEVDNVQLPDPKRKKSQEDKEEQQEQENERARKEVEEHLRARILEDMQDQNKDASE